MVNEVFIGLLKNYTADNKLIDELWREVYKNYTSNKRHYHTLHHLENLLTELIEVKEKIKNWHVALFTLYYHDIIYNSLKSDNEEMSAELAVKRLK